MGGLLILRLVNVAVSCLFLFFLATNGASIPTQILENNKNGSIVYPQSLYFVGMADGKAFFVDNNVGLNWTDAKAYCEKANMQLASITSKAQADMLNNSWNGDNFFNGYWTSGRDVLDLQQFIWDDDNKQPDGAYLTFKTLHLTTAQQTCLYYDSLEGNSSVRNYPCCWGRRPLCVTGSLRRN